MILLLSILYNALEAIYEGLYDNGKKLLSGIIEFISKLFSVATVAYITYGVTVGLITIPIWKLIIGFILIRFLLFDFVYNKVRGLPALFTGSTKIYDKLLSKIPSHFILFIKVIAGIIGIIFLLGLN